MRLFRRQAEKKQMALYWQDYILIALLGLIGLAEVAHLTMVVLHRSFTEGTKLFVAGFVVAVILYAIFLWINLKRKKKLPAQAMSTGSKPWTVQQQILFFVFGAMALVQILTIATNKAVYFGGDMTAETVNSFLTTDTVYQVNPMTGRPYELGIPSRLKILCLPSLYAFICNIFKVDVTQVIWVAVPVITLLAGYVAYSLLARIFFPENRFLRGCFLALVALLFWVGDYMYCMDGFGVLHCGYRGVTIRGVILIPYVVSLALRKRWMLTVLCIAAEACIVWTLYGLGACVFVVIGLFVVNLVLEQKGVVKTGKEDAVCRNS